ncbi:MAG: molybdopterin-dependent oxidoreductase [Nitrospiraceae bacterium]|nr:MAG: molybdopterin-dependent oxidoreductase [Nitrospiraceae bacterium]
MLINLNRCIGCQACQMVCKSEFNIPFGTSRCRIETVRSGNYPHLKKIFLPRLCNHCDSAPCIDACEEQALVKNQDGVVVFDKQKCTGCQICYDKCPYDAIEINEESAQVEKCDFCYDNRIVHNLSPVCVDSCMGKAMIFGDLNNKTSEISHALTQKNQYVRFSEHPTNPSIFYTINDPIDINLLSRNIKAKIPSTLRTQSRLPLSPSEHSSSQIFTSDAMCPSECGITVTVENGVATKIHGNPHTLVNNGALCAKGAAGLELTYSQNRIKSPLIRTGNRGDDKWKEITWKEAADHIAGKLIDIKKNYGPESVFLDCGDVTDREAYYRLFHAFGTPNTYNHGSICDPNRKWGQSIMIGDERPLPDIQRPVLVRNDNGNLDLKKKHDIKLLLNIGANPLVATRFNYMSGGIPAAKEENGCMYIVIDPSYTNSSAHADIWLPINPGADAALLASILYCIITDDDPNNDNKKYIDHDFIDKYTTGWTEFKKAFLSYTTRIDESNGLNFFTPEWAEQRTGISQADIRNISHLFGITKPSAIEIGMHGTAHHTNGDVTSILMTAICLITGNMDVPGGLVFIDSQKARKGERTSGKNFLNVIVSRIIKGRENNGKLSALHKDLLGDYPAAWKGVLADMPDKIRNGITLKHGPFKGHHYPVKAFIARAGNPVITAGNTNDWIDSVTAKQKNGDYHLELMVFIDTHINVTGKYADLILPEAGYLERMGVSDVYTMSPEIALRDQTIKPLHNSKTPFEIMTCLSEAFIKNGDPDIKAEDFMKYTDEEDFINEILSEAPGFYNFGHPLPYPDLPEGSLIMGVPDDPTANLDKIKIRQGVPLTVEWLRNNHGVAIWPASYYRYKKSDGSPSGTYPRTGSGRFEFKFSYLEKINSTFGTDFPSTFYWSECKWITSNFHYREKKKEYPFQLISGRAHYAMTMTGICPSLAETETECMKPLNDDFRNVNPAIHNPADKDAIPQYGEKLFHAGTVSIPVLSINTADGNHLRIKTGEIVTLENPLGQRVNGKVYLTEEIMPGVIKTAFGPGGQTASGMGFANNTSGYTFNINELFDSNNLSPFTGMPGFGDIMVKVIKK